MWYLELAEWKGERADEHVMAEVADRLEHLAPMLLTLDRARVQAQLLVGITQFEEGGGCSLSSAVVAAAAAGDLTLEVMVGLYPSLGRGVDSNGVGNGSPQEH